MLLSGNSLIRILIDLAIAGILVYAVYLFLNMLGLPQPVKTLIVLVIAVIALIFLAQLLGIVI